MRWPWRRRPPVEMPMRTADALRQLYHSYQKQGRLWTYSVLSSVVLMCVFSALWLFAVVEFWVLALPLMGIVLSLFEFYRCKGIVRTVRQALIIQRQVDRAEAEAEEERKRQEAEGNS